MFHIILQDNYTEPKSYLTNQRFKETFDKMSYKERVELKTNKILRRKEKNEG